MGLIAERTLQRQLGAARSEASCVLRMRWRSRHHLRPIDDSNTKDRGRLCGGARSHVYILSWRHFRRSNSRGSRAGGIRARHLARSRSAERHALNRALNPSLDDPVIRMRYGKLGHTEFIADQRTPAVHRGRLDPEIDRLGSLLHNAGSDQIHRRTGLATRSGGYDATASVSH